MKGPRPFSSATSIGFRWAATASVLAVIATMCTVVADLWTLIAVCAIIDHVWAVT